MASVVHMLTPATETVLTADGDIRLQGIWIEAPPGKLHLTLGHVDWDFPHIGGVNHPESLGVVGVPHIKLPF